MGYIGSSVSLVAIRPEGDGQKVTNVKIPRMKVYPAGEAPGIQYTIISYPGYGGVTFEGLVPVAQERTVTYVAPGVGAPTLGIYAPTIDVAAAPSYLIQLDDGLWVADDFNRSVLTDENDWVEVLSAWSIDANELQTLTMDESDSAIGQVALRDDGHTSVFGGRAYVAGRMKWNNNQGWPWTSPQFEWRPGEPQRVTNRIENDLTPDPPAITTPEDDCLVLVFCAMSNATVTWVAPSGYTLEASSNTAEYESAVASKSVATAGVEDPAAWGNTGSGSPETENWTICMNPKVPGVAPTVRDVAKTETPHQSSDEVTAPTMEDGDVVMLFQCAQGGNNELRQTEGGTQWDYLGQRVDFGGDDQNSALFGKVITDAAAEPSAWTFTNAYNEQRTYYAVSIEGADYRQKQGYAVEFNDATNDLLLRNYVNNAPLTIGEVSVGPSTNTYYDFEILVEDGQQRAWSYWVAANRLFQTFDKSHDNTAGRYMMVGARHGGSGGYATVNWDDIVSTKGDELIIDGLPAGWKVEVENSTPAVVAGAYQPSRTDPVVRNAQTADSASAQSVTVTKPTGLEDGDVMAAIVGVAGTNSGTWSAPTGWIGPWTAWQSGVYDTAMFMKAVGDASAEATNYQFSYSEGVNRAMSGGIIGLGGVEMQDVVYAWKNDINDATPENPGVTILEDGQVIILLKFAGTGGAGAGTVVAPTGFNLEASVDQTDRVLGIATKIEGNYKGTATGEFTWNDTSQPGGMDTGMHTLALPKAREHAVVRMSRWYNLTGFMDSFGWQVGISEKVPVGGFPEITISDGGDNEVVSHITDAIYPGGQYRWAFENATRPTTRDNWEDEVKADPVTPTGWTERYASADHGGASWLIEDEAAFDVVQAWNILYPTVSGVYHALSLDALDGVEDIDIVVDVSNPSGGKYAGILARGSGTSQATASGYWLRNNGTATLDLREVTNNSAGTTDSADLSTRIGEDFHAAGILRMRLRCVGSDIKGKMWRAGREEPDGWDVEISDSTHSSGYCGIIVEDNAGQFVGFYAKDDVLAHDLDKAQTWVDQHHWTDFGGLATGATNPPSGYTWLNDSSATASLVTADGSSLGGKWLRITQTDANEWKALLWDAPDIAHGPGQELLQKVRWSAIGLGANRGGAFFMGVKGSTTGWSVYVNQVGNSDWLRLTDITRTGTGSNRLNFDYTPNFSADTWYWLRCRFDGQDGSGNGGRVRMKVWEDGELEPMGQDGGFQAGADREGDYGGAVGLTTSFNNQCDNEYDWLAFRQFDPTLNRDNDAPWGARARSAEDQSRARGPYALGLRHTYAPAYGNRPYGLSF